MSDAMLLELISQVPDGRYAGSTEDNDYVFFRLILKTKGPDKGKRLIQIQAAEHWLPGGYILPEYGLRVNHRLEAVRGQFEAAMVDPMEARYQYAEKLGRCSSCGIRLTLQRSRELHIGSECEKSGQGYLEWLLSRQPHLAHWLQSSPVPSSSLSLRTNNVALTSAPPRPRLLL